MSDIVSFRIDSELKKEMDLLKHLNWSELLRQFVQMKIQEEREKREIDHKKRLQAHRIIDAIRESTVHDESWDSTAELRKWRAQRK
jgi:hypothetical protein